MLQVRDLYYNFWNFLHNVSLSTVIYLYILLLLSHRYYKYTKTIISRRKTVKGILDILHSKSFNVGTCLDFNHVGQVRLSPEPEVNPTFVSIDIMLTYLN